MEIKRRKRANKIKRNNDGYLGWSIGANHKGNHLKEEEEENEEDEEDEGEHLLKSA